MKKLFSLLCLTLMAVFAFSQSVHASDNAQPADGLDAWQYAGGWETTSQITEKGVEVSVPGGSTVGGDAWKYKAVIPGDEATLASCFSVKDGKKITLELSVPYYDENDNLLFYSNNQDASLWIRAIGIYADGSMAQIAGIKLWCDASKANGTHTPSEVYGADGDWTNYGAGKWIDGNAGSNSPYKVQFDAVNLFSASINGEMECLDARGEDFLAARYAALEGVEYIRFEVNGNGGFDKEGKVIVRSINDKFLGVVVNPEAPEYKISFDGVEQIVKEGAPIVAPNDPVIDGYRFVGWFDGETKFEVGMVATSDMAFIAKYEEIVAPELTLNEQPVDGLEAWQYGGGWETTSQFSEAGVVITVPGASTVGDGEAWKYKGVIPGDEAALANCFSIKDNKKITLEISVPYYDANGNVNFWSKNGNAAIWIRAIGVYADGSMFQVAGIKLWADSALGNGGTHTASEVYGNDGDWTNYGAGKWIDGNAGVNGSYHIQFDAYNLFSATINGEMQCLDNRNADFLATRAEILANIEYIRFEVNGDGGFNKDGTIIVKSINGKSLGVAPAAKEYTVSFDGVEQKVLEGALAVVPENPAKEHHTFAGWVNEANEVVDLTQPITSDLVLVSAWNVNKYTVKFGDDSQELAYGSEIVAPSDPVLEGHTFVGWFNGDEKFVVGTLVSGDVTYEAKFEKNEEPSDEPTVPTEPTEDPTEPTDEPSNPLAGCLGSITTSLFGLCSLAGIVVVLKRKREE